MYYPPRTIDREGRNSTPYNSMFSAFRQALEEGALGAIGLFIEVGS